MKLDTYFSFYYLLRDILHAIKIKGIHIIKLGSIGTFFRLRGQPHNSVRFLSKSRYVNAAFKPEFAKISETSMGVAY